MSPSHYTRIVLNERPPNEGGIENFPNTFRSEKLPFNSLKPAGTQVLVQVTYLQLDPAQRGYLKDVRSYLPPVQIGEVMRGYGMGFVLAKGPRSSLEVGQYVTGPVGWTDYTLMEEKHLTKLDIPNGLDPVDFLNAVGSSGMTAYFGLKDICTPRAGEKLLVSGAAGSVGAMACQLGKRWGLKVYAIAGSQEKCEWLEKDLGVERAINYKSPTFVQDLKSIGYIDIYFDNVGGDILNLVLTRLNMKARIALCGAISSYNNAKPPGLNSYLNLISQRAKIEGFIVFDYAKRYPEAIEEIAKGMADGSIKVKFHIVEGLEKAPEALPMLFTGGNLGKLLVKVTNDSAAKL